MFPYSYYTPFINYGYRNFNADLVNQRAGYEINKPTRTEVGFRRATTAGLLGAGLTYAALRIFKNDTARGATKDFLSKVYNFLKI